VDKGGEPVKFDTFTGVFTPTLLTILGVILYVRLGWRRRWCWSVRLPTVSPPRPMPT